MKNLKNYFRKKVFIRGLLVITGILFISGCTGQEKLTLADSAETEYSILLDPSAPETVRIAADDLVAYFAKVTGASPEIRMGSQIPQSPFISLGTNVASRATGLATRDIPIDGFRIVTEGKNIYILGTDTPDGQVNGMGGINRGTSNGVYGFIEDYLGVRWLMPGELGEEYSTISTLKIPSIDRLESSPFNRRVIFFRNHDLIEEEWDRRMKLGAVSAIEYHHNWIKTVPPHLYEEHPEWFAMIDGKRIPPVGNHKLETTNPELVQYFADRVIDAFREDPNRKWFSLTPSDGGGYSESPESMALVEKDPWGNLSRTPLILKFYNDVAKIVGEEYPDRWLGGLLYGNVGGFRFPPRNGLEIEPNLALMIPNGPAYGFRLYRQFSRDNWADSIYIPEWSELSEKYGFDIYYDDYFTTLVQPNAIICPQAPDLLNFTFSGLVKYNFKGGNIAGNPVWPVYGPGNYALAKLFWDPEEDAGQIMHDYYRLAYGKKAGGYIEKLYHLLDTAFSNYYNKNLKAAWSLQEFHLEGIYAPHYRDMEDYFLEAFSAAKEERHRLRLEKFGQVLSLMQWNLKDQGFFPEDYVSALTKTDEEIDALIAGQGDDCRITRKISFQPDRLKVDPVPALPDADETAVPLVPVARGITILLYAANNGEINIKVEKFNKRAEFVQFVLTGAKGEQILTGAIAEGRTISFNGAEGNHYFLHVACRSASGEFRVTGASVAYKLIGKRGLILDGNYLEEPLALYFFVPDDLPDFSIILGKPGGSQEPLQKYIQLRAVGWENWITEKTGLHI